ncbi:MAG TPA: CHAP domain-containing protein [Pirellulales bacterium]|nr:CHAP domain-containing protein [Pirellulales bacterium]
MSRFSSIKLSAAKLITALVVALFLAQPSAGDFVELERLLKEPGAELAEKLDGAPVVITVRNGAAQAEPWNVGQAAALELAAALHRKQIDVIRAAADSRFEQLETTDKPLTANQTKLLKDTDRRAIVGVEWLAGKRSRLRIVAFAIKSAKPLWNRLIDVPEAAVSLDKNIPPLNRGVAAYAQKELGTMVGNGECTEVGEYGLKAAGTGRRGPYLWGRMLGPREQWMPGDIVQMERTSIEVPNGFRYLPHHTAVIEEVRKDAIVVLHQNAYPDGKIVQRDTWPLAGIKGNMAVFRPWDWPKDNPMPPSAPVRATLATVPNQKKKKKDEPINLLELIDPRLDRVRGVWFFEKDGDLKTPREFEARLQVAVRPPKSYSLEMTVERTQGSECLALGITVDGHQTMLAIDGFNSRFSGIHNLDGKPANENESTKAGTFLPLHRKAQLQCRVRRDEISLDIDQEPVIHWRGNAERLSLSPDWPVPHSDWLFLGAFDSEFDISSFTLEPAP